MPSEFTMTRRVQFAETDMAGIVHFSWYYRYMEETEHAFFRSLGFSIHQVVDGMTISWPRLSAGCDFRQPLRFEDVLQIELLIEAVSNRTIRYVYHFYREGDAQRVLLARGTMTTVCVALESGKAMRAVPIPSAIAAQVEPAPPHRLTEGMTQHE